MRSRTSNIKRRSYLKKYSKKTQEVTQQSTTQTQTQTQPQTTPQTQPQTQQQIKSKSGLRGAHAVIRSVQEDKDKKDKDRKVSRDLKGNEIKTDNEGEYDLSQIKDKNVVEQFFTGVPVPTEQIVQIPKDIIEGVPAENQAMKESLFDLGVTPLIRPFVTAKQEGLTDKDWYWPEQLTFENESLPPFLQKGGGSTMDPLQGIAQNIGIIGDVVTHESTGGMIASSYEKSGERFLEAPAYYIGTGVGEIPYWVIGLGQAKTAATVSTKTLATATKITAATGKLPSPKVLKKIVQLERTSNKLNSNIAKAKVAILKSKGTTAMLGPVVNKAYKLIKEDLNVKNIEENKQLLADIASKTNKKNELIQEQKDNIKNNKSNTNTDKKLEQLKSELNTLETTRKKNMRKSESDKIRDKIKDIKDNPKSGYDGMEDIEWVETHIQPIMNKKYNEIKVTQDNIIKMRLKHLEGKLDKVTIKYDALKKKENLTSRETTKIIKLNDNIEALTNEIKDTRLTQKTPFDKKLDAITLGPNLLYTKIKNKLSVKSTRFGDTVPQYSRELYPGHTGRLEYLWYKSVDAVKHSRGKTVRELSKLMESKIPQMRILKEDDIRKLDEVLNNEEIALNASLKHYIPEGIPTPGKKGETPEKPLLSYDDILERLKQIETLKGDMSRYTIKLGSGEKTPKSMYVDLNFLKAFESDEYKKLIPKEIIQAIKPEVKLEMRDGVITGTVGDAFELIAYKKPDKPKTRFGKVKKRLKPKIPKYSNRLTIDNMEIVLYSRKISHAGTDVVRVPKNAAPDITAQLRHLGFMRKEDKPDTAFSALTGSDNFDIYVAHRLSDKQISAAMDDFPDQPLTNVADEKNLKTGDTKSLSNYERNVTRNVKEIQATRDMLFGRSDYSAELESVKKRIIKLQNNPDLVKSPKLELRGLAERREELSAKIIQVEELQEQFKKHGIAHGSTRGQIAVIPDTNVLKMMPDVNQIHSAIYNKRTGDIFYKHLSPDGKMSYWKVNDPSVFIKNLIVPADTKYASKVPDSSLGIEYGNFKSYPHDQFEDGNKQFITVGGPNTEDTVFGKHTAEWRKKQIILDENQMQKNPEGIDYMTKLSDKEANDLNLGFGFGNIKTKIDDTIKEVEKSKPNPKLDSDGNITKANLSESHKVKSDVIKTVGSSSIDKLKNISSITKGIKQSIMGDEYDVLSIPSLSQDPTSVSYSGRIYYGVYEALGGMDPRIKDLIASKDRLTTGKTADDMKTSTFLFNVQENAKDGFNIYNITDLQVPSARLSDDKMSGFMKYVLTKQQENEFKKAEIPLDDTYQQLHHIAKQKNMEEGFLIRLVQRYRKVKGEKDMSEWDITQNYFHYNEMGDLKLQPKFTEIIDDIKESNMLRDPTTADFAKPKRYKKRSRDLDTRLGIIGLKHNFPELAVNLPTYGLKGLKNKLRYGVVKKLSGTSKFLVSDGLDPKDSLMSGFITRALYGVSSKRLVSIAQDPRIKAGFIKGIEDASAHGVKIPRTYWNLYMGLKGKLDHAQTRKLNKLVDTLAEDSKLYRDDGVSDLNTYGSMGEGSYIVGKLTKHEHAMLNITLREIEVLENKIKRIHPTQWKELSDLSGDLRAAYVQKAYYEKKHLDPNDMNSIRDRLNALKTMGKKLDMSDDPEYIKQYNKALELLGRPELGIQRKLLNRNPTIIVKSNIDETTIMLGRELGDRAPDELIHQRITTQDEWVKLDQDQRLNFLRTYGYEIDLGGADVYKMVIDGTVTYKSRIPTFSEIKKMDPDIIMERSKWDEMTNDAKMKIINEDLKGVSIKTESYNIELARNRSIKSIDKDDTRKWVIVTTGDSDQILKNLDTLIKTEEGTTEYEIAKHRVGISIYKPNHPSALTPSNKFNTNYEKIDKIIRDPKTTNQEIFDDQFDYFVYDPKVGVTGERKLRDELLELNTRKETAKILGVDIDAYKPAKELKLLLGKKQMIEDKINLLGEKINRAKGKNDKKQVSKSENRLTQHKKELSKINSDIETQIAAMKTVSPKTIQKHYNPGKPENPAQLDKKIVGFDSFDTSKFVNNQSTSPTLTTTTAATTATLAGTDAVNDIKIDKGRQPNRLIQNAFAETQVPRVDSVPKTILDTSIDANLTYLSSKLSSTINPIINPIVGTKSFLSMTTIPSTTNQQKTFTLPSIIQITSNYQSQINPTTLLTGSISKSIQGLKTGQAQIQDQVYKQTYELLPQRIRTPYLGTESFIRKERIRTMTPFAMGIPPVQSPGYQFARRRRKSKGKKKKTWWQTPGWWYEDDYWGGKDNLGPGYITFKGKEPGKVKRYEKKTFGMGVGF